MLVDLVYDGQTVTWGTQTFKAASGLPGYQQPANQCQKDSGPIPEGLGQLGAKSRAATAGR
jgi:hypothetical protein